jgi:cytosine/adenosine deaminase-related metal-dependent hydrolase
VFPIDRPPLEDGFVTVAAGRIVEVGVGPPPPGVIDLGHAVLLPGLINAHTHLEFSHFSQPLGTALGSFPAWIGDVVAWRRSLGEDERVVLRHNAVAAGLRESAQAGVAAVGEIAPPGWPVDPFRAGGWGVVFLELLGLATERHEALLAAAREHVATHLPAGWSPGFSPHAPYTVAPDLVAEVCRLSAEYHAPVAMHLAETLEELELLASHAGPLVTLLEDLEAWRPDRVPRGIRPLDYLELLATAERALVIHGNYLAADEIAWLSSRRETMSVVYCPRTHAYFHRGLHPLPRLLEAGAAVAVGTDSRASTPDLSLWEELRFIRHRFPTLADETILALGTIHGARALGLENELGSITPGKRAALAVIQLASPSATLWESAACRAL